MREDIRDKLLNIFYILFISIFIFVVWTAIFNSVDLFYRMNSMINIILSIIFFIFLYLTYVALKSYNYKFWCIDKFTNNFFIFLFSESWLGFWNCYT